MGAAEDAIADTVLATFNSLPAKFKPVKATEQFFQWVPLSGIVATRGTFAIVFHWIQLISQILDGDLKPTCLALG